MPNPIPITVISKSLKRKQIWGECDESTRTIWVEKKHPNSQALLGTLLHEAIHLIAADAGNPDWPEGWKTVREIAAETGFSEHHTWKQLRQLHERGKIERRRFKICTGTTIRPVPHYQVRASP